MYAQSFIGLDVVVTMSRSRDINVLVTGNVEFPGIYTLSGNSNILQALNVSGGANENGSLRNIVIKRKDRPDINVDLYQALIFGNIDSIPFLMSGDSIHVKPVQNLVRAGYGFNNTAVFEMLDNETIRDLVNYAGGLKIEAKADSLKIVRFNDNEFDSFNLSINDLENFKVKNLDSIYAEKREYWSYNCIWECKIPWKIFNIINN